MKDVIKNHAASVRARLLNRSREHREDFNLSLQRYSAERFLYRLGASRHRETFILKGAMLFALWGGSIYRATRDLDLTGYSEDNSDSLVAIVREICIVPCPEDGLLFKTSTVQAEPIRVLDEYHGFRVKLLVFLGTARIPLQIDVGFGNAIEPPALDEEYPVLLNGPVPHIRAYPREAVVAEKLHAMVVHGAVNTRYKDFYDLFALATNFPFEGPVLTRAIAKTFERRRTAISDALPVALTSGFYSEPKRAEAWRLYLSKADLPGAPLDFSLTGELLQIFLGPLWSTISEGRTLTKNWPPKGQWAASREESTG